MKPMVRIFVLAALVLALVAGAWSLPAVAAAPGAKFVAYVSPQNQTAQRVTKWEIHIQARGGSWQGTMSSGGSMSLQTPKLSGIFNVRVIASGPNMPEKQLSPKPDSRADIGCNNNCTGIIGIIASPDGKDAHYWTVWDAVCTR